MKNKKYLVIFGIVILIMLSGLSNGLNLSSANKKNDYEEKFVIQSYKTKAYFSSLSFESHNRNAIDIHLEGTNSYLMEPGKPVLPIYVKSIELPFGVRNIKVEVEPNEIETQTLPFPIRHAQKPVPLIPYVDVDMRTEKDENVYSGVNLYPSAWHSYRIGCGLNAENLRVTYVTIYIYPVRYIGATNEVVIARDFDVRITYESLNEYFSSTTTEYDMVIIAPNKFTKALQALVEHKNRIGIRTLLKTTESIYENYEGRDQPEKIKHFIKDAIESWNITYVLLVGGLKSQIWANPREHMNYGAKWWYVPVRYTNFFDNPEHPLSAEKLHDPGVICDLYYADIYKYNESSGKYEFDDWDPNGDGIFAAWGRPGVANESENGSGLDLIPDVSLGRLACTNLFEVRTVVNKIIRYESKPADPSWFKKMIVISGDGFLDQEDLDIQWNTSGLPNGKYTIYAQSINIDGIAGEPDIIPITIDRNKRTKITFKHADHKKVSSYPALPVAEIVSVSPYDILGKDDYTYEPTESEAYCNSINGWANINYTNGILHIRGKSYDPRPYGNVTSIHVWIEDEYGNIVFQDWRNGTEMYYEGEWITGERSLKGVGGALYYMPTDYEREIIWASNGNLTGQNDVIRAFSKGAGFVFFSGHGSPNVWADHYPGIPGNRQHASIVGLQVSSLKLYPPFLTFPMNRLMNIDKLPVVVVGGCHNSQFNVSAIPAFIDIFNKRFMWTFGSPTPECFSWYLVKLPRRGAIAAIGNTGLGYGTLGEDCTIAGLDGGICIEFFRQYGTEGHHVLGDAYTQTLVHYATHFPMNNMDHVKSLQQWTLLGDPSLMLGGYISS